ncbi:MAG: CRTAC1 family protein, partial [Cyclobacteriaceae bacterium]
MNYKAVRTYIGLCIIIFTFFSCQEDKTNANTLFKKVPASHSNIDFENSLKEDDHFNIIEYLYFYNGGGVAAGDINNDGLPDLYFTSNMGASKLYLNKGNLEFEDITSKAGVSGVGNWKMGVTMADVNADGFLDIFICGVGNYKEFNGKNQLLINEGDLTFKDMTEDYGLSFSGLSSHASFFDYDNDGDLDMYLLNHSVHSVRTYGKSTLRREKDAYAGDKLYRNELVPSGANHFTEVTSAAGILSSQIGYGLGLGISDLNNDGYSDIYVSNDFHENDYLYVNQGDGTFKQVLENSMAHTSRFSMGNDIADINNDGWNDIVTLDMLPDQEEVIKTTAGEDPYDVYEFKLRLGYHPQVMRNTLQLNQGVTREGDMVFSDIGLFSGIAATDWSWAPLVADFDNDGYKDLFVTNGIVRRPNDLDYIHYMSGDSAQHFSTDKQLIERMPPGSVPNIIFRNGHDLTFKDVTEAWLGMESSISNGAAYADLDNDGDLDIATNNINEKASIYRNDLPGDSKYLKVKLNGLRGNIFGVGARITMYAGDRTLYFEQMSSRGWQSSVDHIIHAGLGQVETVDSVVVVWAGQRAQTVLSVKANQVLNLFEKDAHATLKLPSEERAEWALQLINDSVVTHIENYFVSFNVEKSIPYMLTTQGPGISVADVNGDRLEDFFIGGASEQPGAVFLQTPSGDFSQSMQPLLRSDALREDVASAFFHADNNNSPDLIVVGGGQQFRGKSMNLAPGLYLNDGRGNFSRRGNLPNIFTDASCVKPGDCDGDGDIDLFIGGRVIAQQYGINPKSYILINDGQGNFTDESEKWFSHETAFGMVTDAEWVDFNKDKRMDLVVVGE